MKHSPAPRAGTSYRPSILGIVRAGMRGLSGKLGGLWANLSAQDVIEYALMAVFAAVMASATLPTTRNTISTVY